ncbi:MAG TPA: hypothetical protein VGO68_07375 [Pyrinomonadaceae bacterium]|nr:hypothetical protein [Pyrinomonadaceae bacterium]
MDQQLEGISKRLDKLADFLRQNMVTKHEFEDLKADLPTKPEFHQLQTAVDGIAKRFKDTDEDLQVVGERTSRMEKWIQRAANKIGVAYKP